MLLAKRLNLHDRAVHECAVRNPVAKVHTYPDQAFVVLHAPEQGRGGHVHFVELDQVVGPNWLLTVHGPMNVAVELDAAYVETSTVARRLARGTLRPTRACELSGALVNVLADRMRNYLIALTQQAWALEQQVTAGHMGDTEQFLEELFGVRHGLLAVATMAATSREVYGRMVRREVFGAAGAAGLADLEDQFRRIAAMADGQREYLQGVIEFYQTRTGTKMTIAAERLAVIAAVTLPITALSSILGMNVIVSDHDAGGAARGAAGDHARDVRGAAGVDAAQGLVVTPPVGATVADPAERGVRRSSQRATRSPQVDRPPPRASYGTRRMLRITE